MYVWTKRRDVVSASRCEYRHPVARGRAEGGGGGRGWCVLVGGGG
eukprot:COSAG03_NODE_22319_length_292_cov_1.461140_2_plen_44_part_01